MARITDLYVPYAATNAFGNSLGQANIVAPPGTPGIDLSVFGDLTQILNMAAVGIYTPWAGRTGGMDWTPVRQPPDTNIALFGLTDQLIDSARMAMFNNPLPFVAVLAPAQPPRIPSMDETIAAFQGTPYEFYQTQAAYGQADAGEPPTVVLIHWAKIRDQGDQSGGTGSMEEAAFRADGNLVFAMQVNYDTTRTRQPPATPFAEALSLQMGVLPAPEPGLPPPSLPGDQPGVPTEPYPTPTAPAKATTPWLPIIAAGLVAGVAGFVVVRSVREKKGR